MCRVPFELRRAFRRPASTARGTRAIWARPLWATSAPDGCSLRKASASQCACLQPLSVSAPLPQFDGGVACQSETELEPLLERGVRAYRMNVALPAGSPAPRPGASCRLPRETRQSIICPLGNDVHLQSAAGADMGNLGPDKGHLPSPPGRHKAQGQDGRAVPGLSKAAGSEHIEPGNKRPQFRFPTAAGPRRMRLLESPALGRARRGPQYFDGPKGPGLTVYRTSRATLLEVR